MSRLSISVSLVTAALLAAMSATPARAETYDKLTFMTFSGPVQIPGGLLGAGTYRFHLVNPDSSRNVLQVLSNDGQTVYSMFHTTPDSRSTVTEEAMVTFREAPAGVAPPVRSLFYGGESRGYAFVYGRGEPNLIPRVTPQPTIAFTPNPPAVEPEPAAPAAVPEPIAAEPMIEPTATAAAALPATASHLPLVGFGGVALLVLGLGVGLLRRHVA